MSLSNWKPSNTRAWHRAVARVVSGGVAARINVFGPSTVAGYIGPPGRSEWHAWPSYLRRMMAKQYGESGTGVIYFGEPDTRIYTSGWKIDEPYGPYGKSCFSSNTPSALLAFGPVRATGFRITYLTVPGSGKFQAYALNSGRTPVIIDTAGAAGVGTYAIPAGTLGDWQLRIQPIGNAPVFIIAVEGYVGPTTTWTSTGVAVTNVGKGSTIVDNLNNGDPVFDSSLKAAVDANSADLSIVAFAENSPGRQTPEAFKTDMRVLLNRARATGSDLLLCTSIDWQGEPANLYAPQEEYDVAVRELADEYDAPLFDIAERWGHMEDSPSFYADNIHPTPAGHADIAAGVFRALHTDV